jgi:hypothetical protein
MRCSTDRIEAVLRAVLVAVFVIGAPIATASLVGCTPPGCGPGGRGRRHGIASRRLCFTADRQARPGGILPSLPPS